MSEQKLTREQILWVEKFQDYWGQFLSHLGATFFGNQEPQPMIRGANIVEAVVEKVYQTALHECRGTLELNRLTMLFGRIVGIQFGIGAVQRGEHESDPTFPVEAARMFEAAFRVAYEEVLAKNPKDKPKIFGPGGGLLS